ncbi:Ig-like domain-containing protein [Brevibacillus reuszeri]|uniref:Ig-like domain-containing protein n=1 Tax=Brevibacillus reuszeri TaxID=54915 RepID=UPI0035E3C15A
MPPNGTSNLISLRDYFIDPDGDRLTFSIEFEFGTGFVCTFNDDITSPNYGKIVFHVAPNNSGSAIVKVTANDGKGGTVSDQFEIRIS